MFFWRHDGQFLRRSKRRLGSPRGAVFTEFAFIAPVLVLLVSAMIELASYWDARIMANHAAWTIGRQVSVYGTNLRFGEEPDWIKRGIGSGCSESVRKTFLDPLNGAIRGASKKLNDRGMVTTAFLMSTCGMGYFGTTPGREVGDLLKKFTDPLQKLMDELAKSVAAIGTGLESLKLPFKADNVPGLFKLGGILEKITKFIGETVIGGILKEVIKPLQKILTTKLNEKIEQVVVPWFNKLLAGPGNAKRRFRQTFGAFARISQVDDVIRFEEYGNGTKLGGTTYRCFSRNQPLDYPQTFTEESAASKRVCGWPPYHQTHGMVKVTVAWPFSTGWLFPVVSGFRSGAGSVTNSVRATGHALVFQQPKINNDNLRSVGVVTFDVGTTNLVDAAVKESMSEAKRYFTMVAFAYRYRLGEETVYAFDPRPTSADTSRKYLKPLCDWYGFQKKNGEYDRKKAQATEDYNSSWKDITGSPYYYIKMPTANKRVHGDEAGTGTAYLDKEWLHIFSDDNHHKARHRYGGVKNARSHFYTYSLGRRPGTGEPVATGPLYLGTKDAAYGRLGDLPAGFGGTFGPGALSTNSSAGVNMDLWLSVYRSEEKAAAAKAEAALLKKTLDLNARMTNLESALRSYAQEIEDSLAGGGRNGTVCGLVPDTKEVDVTDPKAVAKWAEEKVRKIKDATLPIFNKIDEALVDFRKAFDDHNKKAEAILKERGEELKKLLRDIERLSPGSGEASDPAKRAETIRKLLQELGKGTNPYDPQVGLKELDGGIKGISDKIDALFKLETDYAKEFGSATAARYAGKSIGEINWNLERQRLVGGQYGKSGFVGGNDDDLVGDEWKHTEEGWK